MKYVNRKNEKVFHFPCLICHHPLPLSGTYLFAQVDATGVCHTDWEYLYETGKGMTFRPFPLVLGHEAAGIVESVGPEVTLFSPGKSKTKRLTFYSRF